MANEVTSSAASPISSSPVLEEENTCRWCEEKLKQPKVLSCLHVFCLSCIEKHMNDKSKKLGAIPEVIVCRICNEETKIPSKGIGDLLTDYVIAEMMEVSSPEDVVIVCTSCKAKEKAVARCSDCANFLCPNCVTAHQYMRCFENHKVLSFEEMQNGEGLALQKPIFCKIHPSENMKYYCITCQVPICNECMLTDHKQPNHTCERIADLEGKQTEELNNLIQESKAKIDFCEEASNSLEIALTELQMQRDNAKGLIQETFQSYKTLLEKRRDTLLRELEEIHAAQEMSVLEMIHNVEKITEKIEDGCKFTERVLKNGSSVHILMLKKIITSQLLSLINNTPKPEVNINIDFKSDEKAFEDAIKRTFGYFVKDEPKVDMLQISSSLHSSFENEGFSLPSGVLSPELPQVSAPEFIPHMQRTVTPVPVTSVPSMNHLHNITSVPSSLPCAITGAHSIPENSLSRSSHSPAMSDSGISVDAASTNSAPSAPLFNLSSLAKVGNVGFNSQGQVTLNGQIVPGLTMSGPPSGSRNQTPISQTAPTLASMLSPTGTAPSVQTPNLDTLVSLLNQPPPPQLNGIGNLGALGNLENLANFGNINPLNNVNSMISPPGSMSNSPGLSMSNNTFSSAGSPPYPPVRRSNKMSPMQIRGNSLNVIQKAPRCKFGQLGPAKGQFNSPHGFCLGLEEDIIVADTNNHRIQVFEKTGEFKYQFGIPGREEGQLWYPRKVAVVRNSGKYVVCDRGNERSRMQIFTKNGHFIKKIAIRYIDIVAGLAITQQGYIVAVDSVSPTVFCIAESGDLIKWFDCSDYMREPSDIAISGKEYFVCDFKGHCVVVFNEDGQFMRRIGCENITNYPNGIDISDAGDVLVGDSHGNRFHVAVFQRDGSLIGEFECPYVKVSRCCGLKITSEGYIVTLAKNNHHVLILNTLYIT